MTDRVRETAGEVDAAVRGMYAGLGDPARFDRFLHEDITIWESDQPGPRIGLGELQALRERRSDAAQAADAPRPEVDVVDLLVDRWGEVAAVARYVLRARVGEATEEFRVTDVWHHEPDGWRIVHHHAEAVPAASGMHEDVSRGDATVRATATEESSHAG